MNKQDKIYIAGHAGLVGSAIVRELRRQGFRNLCFMPHTKLDLRDQEAVASFFSVEKPDGTR